LLGEANVTPEESPSSPAATGCTCCSTSGSTSTCSARFASGDARPLAAALRATRKLPPTAQWAHFLRNHDELDLGRLSSQQRNLVFERFAPKPSMRLYDRGIRRRLAPDAR
jgi:maltose alpha-D-glucosyltransferase/alpha-amylase